MYGFGDDQNPYSESVDLIEDMVVEYITELVSIYYIKNICNVCVGVGGGWGAGGGGCANYTPYL